VLRAERRVSDDKGKVVMIDEGCRIRRINEHDGRSHAMGIFHSASRPEEVFAFADAALRDAWVSMLQVHSSLCFIHLFFTHAGSGGTSHERCCACGAGRRGGAVVLAAHEGGSDKMLLQAAVKHPAVVRTFEPTATRFLSRRCRTFSQRTSLPQFTHTLAFFSLTRRLLLLQQQLLQLLPKPNNDVKLQKRRQKQSASVHRLLLLLLPKPNDDGTLK